MRKWQEICVQAKMMDVNVFFDGREVCQKRFSSSILYFSKRTLWLSNPWNDAADAHIRDLTISGNLKIPTEEETKKWVFSKVQTWLWVSVIEKFLKVSRLWCS